LKKILTGFVNSRLIKALWRAWMFIGEVIGWVMSRLILIVLFYVLLTPITILSKIVGKKFLKLGFNNDKDSYWIPQQEQEFKPEQYERQF